MVNARDFKPGQSAIFARTLMWRRDLHRYGQMCRELGDTDRGNPRWHELQSECAQLRHELASRAATAEVEAGRHVATE